MTENQIELLLGLLGRVGPMDDTLQARLKECLRRNERPEDAHLADLLEALQQLDKQIRQAYVVHTPSEFRVLVGHHDTHRMPGSLAIAVGDVVRLVGHTTERWIPVRVTAVPKTPREYYQGVIEAQLVPNSKFQAGNGVRFGEDQVMAN